MSIINSLPVPINFTAAGAVQRTPDDLRNDLIALVASENPGYTVLPAGLIEDLSSTAVGALQMIDQAFVTFINSIGPETSNAYILAKQGSIFGPVPGQPTNTSVNVQFSSNTPGFPIGIGFLISDGSHQYAVSNNAVIGSGGMSLVVSAVATQPGTWPVPAGSVNQVVSPLPPGVTLTVNNAIAGIPSGPAETVSAFRARVLESAQAISTGVVTTLKSALKAVPGVVPRLVSVRLIAGVGWEIICGGGDIYQVANVIALAMGGDIPLLTGSVMGVTSITQANPGVVTTDINHGFITGAVVQINGALGMTAVNGVPFTITVISPTTFSIGVDTSGYGAYIGSGVVTPNNRNITASIYDYPDTYSITFVNPPQQVVTMTVTWNTNDTNFTATAAVAIVTIPQLVNYINNIEGGQPINIFTMEQMFLSALVGTIDPSLITRLVFAVAINGIGTAPVSGTGIIPGDPESYFEVLASAIVVNQG